jgi:hypothetical protein
LLWGVWQVRGTCLTPLRCGRWAALVHPAIFVGLLIAFLLLLCGLLPRLQRGIRSVLGRIAGLFGRRPPQAPPALAT